MNKHHLEPLLIELLSIPPIRNPCIEPLASELSSSLASSITTSSSVLSTNTWMISSLTRTLDLLVHDRGSDDMLVHINPHHVDGRQHYQILNGHDSSLVLLSSCTTLDIRMKAGPTPGLVPPFCPAWHSVMKNCFVLRDWARPCSYMKSAMLVQLWLELILLWVRNANSVYIRRYQDFFCV